MPAAKQNSYQRGQWAEDTALEFLKKKGLRLLEHNYHGPAGEIDLIMLDNNTIAFVEVRYRAASHFAAAIESVDRRKCGRIIKTSQLYLQSNRWTSKNTCRFDVITISGDTGTPEIGWIKDAFQA